MPTRIEHELRMETTDLLHSLSEMIASAQSRIILASPFWDATTANELASLLLRRLAAGVDVDILSRFANNDDAGGIVLKKRLSGQPRCRLFRWYEEHGNSSGRQTFHFKAVAIDDGRRGWLGSANFTNSGLRMVMELGVILSGADAQSLYRVLNLVLDIARIIN
jgi:phosphatidylserine/phosphatidylglycerophosphate/cardiolipin synthase-like enzyme